MIELLDWLRDSGSFIIPRSHPDNIWSIVLNHWSWKIGLGLLVIWMLIRFYSIIETLIRKEPSGVVYLIENRYDATEGLMIASEVVMMLFIDGLGGITLVAGLPYIVYGLLWAWPIMLLLGIITLVRYISNRPKKLSQ